MILQIISTFFGTAAFAVLFYSPKQYIVKAGLTGSVGWFIYLMCMQIDQDMILASLIATIGVSLMSHILARKVKAPVTMFFIPGIIPMVPGKGMFLIVRNLIDDNTYMASQYLYETLQIAGAIALGIFIVDTMFRTSMKRPRAELRSKENYRKKKKE